MRLVKHNVHRKKGPLSIASGDFEGQQKDIWLVLPTSHRYFCSDGSSPISVFCIPSGCSGYDAGPKDFEGFKNDQQQK